MRIPTPTFVSILAATHLAACSFPEPTPSRMDLCQQTVIDYATYRDDPNRAEAYGQLFSQNGQFTLGPNTVIGRDALIERHKSANTNTVFSHVMENIKIDGLSGKSRVVVYTKNRQQGAEINRVIIADYIDKFEITNGRCLIADREVSVVFDTAD